MLVLKRENLFVTASTIQCSVKLKIIVTLSYLFNLLKYTYSANGLLSNHVTNSLHFYCHHKLKFLIYYFTADADGAVPDGHQDILTCGVCQKPFALSDIVRFIQHKVASCNKENFASGHCFQGADRERDNDDGALPLSTINTRRPSISAPISGKKASGSSTRVHTPPPASPRLPAPGDLCVDGAASSTPKRRASSSPLTSSLEDGEDLKPNIKQERMDTTSSPEESSHKKSRTEVADAESNTTNSGEYYSL